MASITLYATDEDKQMVKKAGKFIRFYEDKTLSALFLEECRKVIIKYEQKL